MSRKNGWTPRQQRSQDYFIRKVEEGIERSAVKRDGLPGNPSCKKRNGIVVYHSSGISPCDKHKQHMEEIDRVFGKKRKGKK